MPEKEISLREFKLTVTVVIGELVFTAGLVGAISMHEHSVASSGGRLVPLLDVETDEEVLDFEEVVEEVVAL